MNPSDEQLIWRYLDGECDPEEQRTVASRLETDPAFRAAWAERRALHLRLQAVEAEQPSLRFVQNVMDRLPLSLRIEPLVSRRQWRNWLTGAAAFLLALLGLTWSLPPTAAGGTAVEPYLQPFNEFVLGLPQQLLALTGALGIGFLVLVWLDRKLKARFSRAEKPGPVN